MTPEMGRAMVRSYIFMIGWSAVLLSINFAIFAGGCWMVASALHEHHYSLLPLDMLGIGFNAYATNFGLKTIRNTIRNFRSLRAFLKGPQE